MLLNDSIVEWDTTTKVDVTNTYNSNNILSFKGYAINPDNYNGAQFLIVLSSTSTMNRASICYVNFQGGGTESSTVTLAHPGQIYPALSVTGARSVYVYWEGTTSASTIFANMLRIR